MKIEAPALPHPPRPTQGLGDGARTTDNGSPPPSVADNQSLPALVPGEGVVDTSDTHPGPLIPNVDVRALSAREMSDLSFELYANGILSWEEHELLAFQPELNPAYDSTVGALTGETADPDAPKDHLSVWEDRFAFEKKYNPENRDRLYAVRQIVAVLRQLSAPLNVTV